ncbi:MAG: STAS domain-containing protein [Methylococcales bacterium]|jgi:anti-anti-sigma factor|nr:STAS domain-containing protein [Methylococcales bacterium]MBT7443675.1 STAS domain-containing protein [Methylococcales bacterium]
MPISSTVLDNTLTIKVSEQSMRGSLQKDFRSCYTDHINDVEKIVIDFQEVEFAESSGIGLLFLLYGTAKSSPKHPELSIVNASPGIKETMAISGVNRNFTLT